MPQWLIALSSAPEGVSAPSFIQSLTLASSSGQTNLQLTTVGGKPPVFVDQDEAARKWLTEFKTKPTSTPTALSAVDGSRYSALLIPHALGAGKDLIDSPDMAKLLQHFMEHKKPICAIGMGVCALFAGYRESQPWCFEGYSITGSSVFEVARREDFRNLDIVPEDKIKQYGACYACSEPDAVHVVLDRHVISAQNPQSCIAAVQNLALLCSQRVS